MSPKQRFVVLLEPGQLAVLKAIEQRTDAPLAAQIRRAIDAYIDSQTVLSKAETRKLLKG